MIHWTHGTVVPALNTVAILASEGTGDDTSGLLLHSGLYYFGPDGWENDTGMPLCSGPDFWYCTERDLLGHLSVFVAHRQNGHA